MTIIEETYDWAYPLTGRRTTELIILHHEAATAATARQVHSYHLTKGWAGIAYHYFVRKDGKIYRGRPEGTVGGHTAGYNAASVGVCFEGNFQTETMGERQLEAGRELIDYLLGRYPDARVLRHGDVNATACPGKNFPFEEMTDEMTQERFNEMAERWLAYKAELPAPEWADAELGEAIAAGITDGEKPMALIPRYQAAIMAKRARQ